MITVPHAFLESHETKKMLVDGLNCVIHKSTGEENPDNQRYLATHAFTYVQSGALRIDEGDEMKVVDEGETIFLPKGIYMISDIIPLGNKFRAVVFFLEQSTIDIFLKDQFTHENENKVSAKIIAKNPRITTYVQNLINLYADGEDNEVTKSKLTEWLHLIIKTPEGGEILQILSNIKSQEKLAIKTFMERNYDKPLKIEDYANLTGRSISSFHRDFKRLFNQGPKQWLIDRRLDKAKLELKSNRDRTVTAVAYNSGYENVSHFIKAFQSKFGLSPKQYMLKERGDIRV